MLKSLLLLLSICLSLPAFATSFDLEGEMTCETKSGRRILLNDALAGGKGFALESKSPRKALRVTPRIIENGIASLAVDPGLRAHFPDFVLKLDMGNVQETSRQEGADLVPYLYVPARLEITKMSLLGGAQTELEDAKCLQRVL